MFTEEMLAPCGLDCSLCSQAHKKKNACHGCMGADENKPAFCKNRCKVIQCDKRIRNHYRFCDECSDYPCKHLQEIENRYMSQYILKESPFSNLRKMREMGMDAFFDEERKVWACKRCGGVLCVHNGVCSQCGKTFKIWNEIIEEQ